MNDELEKIRIRDYIKSLPFGHKKWTIEEQDLIDKFYAYLATLTVTRNESFYVNLAKEIELGPDSARAKTGELQEGLRLMLYLIAEGQQTIGLSTGEK